jgi:molybdopterin-guanine dinucleotide biosynthesis protein A
MNSIAREEVTGLVLAGGHGSRMGGVDKGLQLLRGKPMALWALERLRPQVGTVAINANRNHEAYAAFGAPVWPDARTDRPGPLAGMLAGLTQCKTEWLLTVPCDTPHFPPDLAQRLGDAALAAGAPVAMPVTEQPPEGPMPQPVFCLLHRSLRSPLAEALAAGERKIDRFTKAHGHVLVPFADAAAFFNANTPEELEQLRRAGAPPAPA